MATIITNGQAIIQRVSSNNNYVWTWDGTPDVPGVSEQAVAANIGAAIDAIRPFANQLPGTIQRVEIVVTSVQQT